MAGIAKIAAGGDHTCALTAGGGVKCWGENIFGQLGDGTTIDRLAPVSVSGLSSGVTAIAAGLSHTCALTSAGGVKCWGLNGNGQLGDGSTTQRLVPVNVIGLLSGVSAIAAGAYHTCALMTTGQVKCWGLNSNGQLGNGTTTQAQLASNVSGLASGVGAVTAGWYHTCALIAAGGGVKCWGSNSSGQVGDGTTMQRLTPTDTGLSGIGALGGGGYHTCAMTVAFGMKCWGWNTFGQLGDGTQTDHSVPTDVPGMTSNVSGIAVGGFHTCAVVIGGSAKCWGMNRFGEIGDNTTTPRFNPTDVAGLSSGVAALAAGIYHTCALTIGGGVKCWGTNYLGELGDGVEAYRTSAAAATGLTSNISAIAEGTYHSCAVTSGGGAKCWGNNGHGQLGNNSYTGGLVAVDVSGLGSGVGALTAGSVHTCALVNGGVKCWGWNYHGQLGSGNQVDAQAPVDVPTLASGVSMVTAGYDHTCALSGGGVKCWGRNGNGQLGIGSTQRQLSPVSVTNLASGVSAVVAGSDHTCALTTGGGVKCWGDNSFGQLGDGSRTDRLVPTDVIGLTSGVSALAAGSTHTCALTSTGGVKCWGSNFFGLLGNGNFTIQLTPVDVTGLSAGVGAIAAGREHTCALMLAGTVKCWGWNGTGQLGDSTTTFRLTPVDVATSGNGVTALAINHSGFHTCALKNNGVQCWGNNSDGELGDGTIGSSLSPVDVVVATPSRLVIALVNNERPILSGGVFSVRIDAQEGNIAGDVQGATSVVVTLTSGTGPLVGTSGCTIAAGTDGCLIPALSLDVLQSGAVLTAHRTSGDALSDGVSEPFSVNPNSVSFAAPVKYVTGGTPLLRVATDMTGLGRIDYAAIDQAGNTAYVLRNNGDGTFQVQNYTVGLHPVEIIACDLNGDTRMDLITVNKDGNSMSVLLNNGDGSFAAAATVTTGNQPAWLACSSGLNGVHSLRVVNQGDSTLMQFLDDKLGHFTTPFATLNVGSQPRFFLLQDFTGDGFNDPVTANFGGDSVTVEVQGLGGNGIYTRTDYPVDSGPVSLNAAVLGGSGSTFFDIVSINQTGNSISVLRNKADGTGTFNPAVTYQVGLSPRAANVADLNHDGFLDVVVRNFGSNDVSVLLNNGDGTFAPAVSYPVGGSPGAFRIGDLNGDGNTDIVVSLIDQSSIAILFGRRDGTFQPPILIPVGLHPGPTPQLVDVNGDARADLGIALQGDGAISVLMNLGSGSVATAGNFFSSSTATGTGTAAIGVTGAGSACQFTSAQFIPAQGGPMSPPVPLPAGYAFPQGLVTFGLGGCAMGNTVTVTVSYPQALPPGTQYWKYGPTPGDPSSHWYVVPATIAGNTVTFTITDGGLGDDDLTANGTIVDQGGVGIPNGAVVLNFDLDVNAHYDPLTDGLMIVRYLRGITGNALIAGTLGANPTVTDPSLIAAHLAALYPLLDVNGDGKIDYLTDGLILMRYLFGLRGDSLVAGLLGPGAKRSSAEIETYIQTFVP